MKIYIISFLFFAYFFSSCTIRNQVETSNQSEITTTNLIQPNSKIILETINKYEGNLWITGEILSFRLYENGTAEFEDFPTEAETGKQLKTEEVKVKKQIKLSNLQLEEINSLLLSHEFKSLKSLYRKIESSCDSGHDLTIKHEKKEIKIYWCDDLANPRHSQDFPKTLSKLIRQIREIKSKALNKQAIDP